MPRRHDRQILLMALVVLGMTSLAVQQSSDPGPIERSVGRTLAPVERLLTSVSMGATGVFDSLRSMDDLRDRNENLESQIHDLEADRTKLEELVRENRQLRDALRFARERVDLDLRGASVVGRKIAEEPGSLLHTIRVDIGSRDGVETGMAVATSRGLVGQISRSGNYWSDVRLVTDPASAVWGRVQRSRVTGMVFGSTTGELRMRFIPQAASGEEPNVAEGDLVYTAGLSHRFPPAVLIGQVVEVHQSDERTHQEAVIRPSVAFNSLETVLVVNDWLPASAAQELERQGDAGGEDEASAPQD